MLTDDLLEIEDTIEVLRGGGGGEFDDLCTKIAAALERCLDGDEEGASEALGHLDRAVKVVTCYTEELHRVRSLWA